MAKLLLIDLDGTARRTKSGEICLTYPKDQVLDRGVDRICKALFNKGWSIAAVTNQGGCESINPDTGKPYKSRRQAVAECKYFLHLARWCDRVYMCPNAKGSSRDEVYRVVRTGLPWPLPRYWVRHEHNDDHPYFQTMGYRKPKPGMLELAIRDEAEEEYNLASSLGAPRCYRSEIVVKALMGGDMESGLEAAKAIKIPYRPVELFLYETTESLAKALEPANTHD